METLINHEIPDNKGKVLLPPRNECIYTSCYCEENVWHLCQVIQTKERSHPMDHKDHMNHFLVVFISNPHEAIPLWKQKAGRCEEDWFVMWDYHVILIDKQDQLVYDLDTVLQFPCNFKEYFSQAIRPDSILNEKFHRHFRVIQAQDFLSTFASDRSHMKHPDGTWIKLPPSYPCIRTSESENNLKNFIRMELEAHESFGQVISGTESFYNMIVNKSENV